MFKSIRKGLVYTFLLLSFRFDAQAQNSNDALKEYNAGNYQTAVSICEEEIRRNDTNIDSYVVLCWSLVANKQYSEAEFWASRAKKISQYDHRVIEVLAEAKYYQGKNNDALALFQEYLSLVPLNADRAGTAFYLMGEIFIRQAKFEHADIALTQAVKIEPLRSAWWVRLAYAREMTRGYAKALLAYEQALSLSPFLEDAVNGRERVKKLIR
ncbi:MAG TPA: hypothetical protein PLU33_09500 [Treponemataceae bacterium]|nr:hypothetical protein [Treponemataceae bacterium]